MYVKVNGTKIKTSQIGITAYNNKTSVLLAINRQDDERKGRLAYKKAEYCYSRGLPY
jgi:hypothetical protein